MKKNIFKIKIKNLNSLESNLFNSKGLICSERTSFFKRTALFHMNQLILND